MWSRIEQKKYTKDIHKSQQSAETMYLQQKLASLKATLMQKNQALVRTRIETQKLERTSQVVTHQANLDQRTLAYLQSYTKMLERLKGKLEESGKVVVDTDMLLPNVQDRNDQLVRIKES